MLKFHLLYRATTEALASVYDPCFIAPKHDRQESCENPRSVPPAFILIKALSQRHCFRASPSYQPQHVPPHQRTQPFAFHCH